MHHSDIPTPPKERRDNSSPIVAIVGRPNVGKSSLFNAMVRRRIAITHHIRGVTHEGASTHYTYRNKSFCLKDTGGITNEGRFAKLIQKSSVDALNSACCVVFVLEAGIITEEDERIARMIRRQALSKTSVPILLVVNKVDNSTREWEAQEAWNMGFGEPLCVSALHAVNIQTLWNMIYGMVFGATTEPEQTSLDTHNQPDTGKQLYEHRPKSDSGNTSVRLLLLGKPNTGKSSFINTVAQSSWMVSPIPGTTRDIAYQPCVYNGVPYVFIDSAGIRRKNKIDDDVEYYSIHRALDALLQCDVVALLVDVTEGFAEQDKKLVSMITRRGKGLILALNKWDLVPDIQNRLQAEKDRLSFLFPQISYAPILPLSARTGYGVHGIMSAAHRLYVQMHKRVETAALNKDIRRWQEEKPPPVIRGKRGKIKYASQVETTPPKFIMKVSNPKMFPNFYRLYIYNKIRAQYDFSEVPFLLDFIQSS